MSPISQRFAIPTDPDQFEKMCRDLLRLYWSRPGLEIFGKRGERQYGIDILDLSGETPLYAAQCKLKEEHKNLAPAEIQSEVDKAKQFAEPLGKYGILTTAKVSTQAQMKVREINEAHKVLGLFEVELLTWEPLCSLLQQYSDVQEQFYGEIAPGRAQRIEAQLVAINDGVQSLTSQGDGDETDSQINEARDYIAKREFQLATLLLNRVQHNKGDKLTPRQKFRVLSNLGAAALGSGKPNEAATFFLGAVSCQPSDEQGKINEVLAYLIIGDLSSCHAKATVLRREYPASPRLAALWVMSAPKEVRVGALECEINSVLRTDAEVSVALARRALMDLAFDKALEYASSAQKSAPKWSQPHLILAQISLGSALHIQFGFRAKGGMQETSLVEAEAAISRALEMAREEKDEQTEKMALVQRVDIWLLLKKIDEAIKDAEEAQKLDAEDTQVMLAMAQVRIASGRVDDGISVLRKAHRLHPDPNVAFVYGRALSNRGREGDLDEALSVLLQVSIQDIRSELRPTFVTQAFQCLAKKKDWAGAETYLSKVAEFLDVVTLRVIRGYLAHYQDQPREAERHALDAQSLLPTANANADTKGFLARLLMLIGRPADALPLWQELFNTEDPFFDPGNLLNCAARLHKDDLVMQTCDQLHARGVNDWHLLEFEVSYLEKYKIDTAIERLQGFIAQHPEHKLAKLRLSLIGLGLNRADLVRGEPEDIPSVDELPINYVLPAVQVMKYGGNPNAAVDYAYRFLRANFNEMRAHQALMVSMMPGLSAPDIPPELEVVGPNAAVCYQEIPQGGETWVVLEDTDKPSGDFEEISLTSPLAVGLCGRRVGETVVIAKGHLQDRSAKIVRILPKYVRRFQDSMGEMQVRFGAASSVESIRIEQPEGGDQRKALEVILASVEKRAAAVAGARETYNTLPASLHWFGTCFGENAYVALMSLAEEEGQAIKCCFGSSEERDRGLQALQTAKGVIVDITALATLRLLRLEKILSSTKFRFIISERTWITLQEMLFNARIFSGPSGTLLFKHGRHVIYEQTAEDNEQRIEKDKEFVQFLERVTEVRSAPGLAAIEPDKRESLEKFFGPYGAESIVLASDPDYVLWTDDLIQAQTAAQEFGSRRVWTQLVLGVLTDAGLLTSDEYSEASANLIGMEFVTTLFDSSSMLAAVRLAGWSVEKSPASQIVKIFSAPAADLQTLLRIFVEFTIRLYREPVSPEIRCSVTQTFLDTLASRPEAMTLLQSLRKLSTRVFGVNEIGRVQFDACFDRWLQHRSKPFVDLV
jgi:tetratricopeptide (TPR) repeat protein